MVAVLYADGDVMKGAWLSSLVGLLIITGEVVGGFVAKYIMHIKWQIVITTLLGGIFFAVVATCTPDTMVAASVFVSLGVFFIGWTESLAITTVTLTADNQSELGSASGVAGSIRFLISSVAATIYTVILTNRLSQTISSQVPPKVISAGLPSTSVGQFIAAFTTGGDAFSKVPGVTPQILAIGTRAYQEANASAYRTVFLTTIAFTGVAVISALLLPNVDHFLTGKVATTLHKGEKGEVVGTK